MIENPDPSLQSTPSAKSEDEKQRKSLIAWQTKLLPFSIIFLGMLSLVYFGIYLYEIGQIHNSRQLENSLSTAQQIDALSKNVPDMGDKLYRAELLTVLYRHQRADTIIESRILTINLSFLTGVILSFVGAIFILGKFSESATKIEAEKDKLKFSLASSSPGIILSTLGVALIIVCIISKTALDVKDQAVYLNVTYQVPNRKDMNKDNSDSVKKAKTKKTQTKINELKKLTQ